MQRSRLVVWLTWLFAAGSALAQRSPAALLETPRVQEAQGSPQVPALQLEPDCDAAFRSALGACWREGPLLTPSSPCCTALGELAPGCWQAVGSNLTANESGTEVKATLDRVLVSCKLIDQPLTNATVPIRPSPYLTNGSSAAFPLVGKMRTEWVLGLGPVPCRRYDPMQDTWVVDRAAPTWGPSSSGSKPNNEDVLNLAGPLCAQPSLAGAAMAEELAAGGERAQVLASALYRATCSSGADLLQLLQSDPRLLNPVTAPRYIEAFVRAADQAGVGACVTAAVINSTGGVQAWAQLHTLAEGPPAANSSITVNSSSGGSERSGGSESSRSSDSSGGSDSSSGGDSSSDDGESAADGSDAGDEGGENGSQGSNSSSSSEVPSGAAESSWVLTPTVAECSTFSPPYTWQDGAPTWAGKGGTEVDQAAAEALARLLCESPASVAGEALYAGFSEGGVAAEVAAAAVLAFECPQGDSDAILDAAFRAFTLQDALDDASTAYRVAQNLVAAADAIGAGACVSIAVLDNSGGVLDQLQLHTSVEDSRGADNSTQTYSQRLLGSGSAVHRSRQSRHQPK